MAGVLEALVVKLEAGVGLGKIGGWTSLSA